MKKDLNTSAFDIVQKATGDKKPESEMQKRGRKGGKRGGKKAAENMTKEQRTARAKKAAKARWDS